MSAPSSSPAPTLAVHGGCARDWGLMPHRVLGCSLATSTHQIRTVPSDSRLHFFLQRLLTPPRFDSNFGDPISTPSDPASAPASPPPTASVPPPRRQRARVSPELWGGGVAASGGAGRTTRLPRRAAPGICSQCTSKRCKAIVPELARVASTIHSTRSKVKKFIKQKKDDPGISEYIDMEKELQEL